MSIPTTPRPLLGADILLSEESDERSGRPIVTGVLDYFPLAIAEVARHSMLGNNKHNPGQPLHWARDKSTDHANCIGRHLIDRGSIGSDGMRHSTALAWRALALLQTELEAEERDASYATKTFLEFPPLSKE